MRGRGLAPQVAFAGIAAGEHTQRNYFGDDVVRPFLFVAIAVASLAAVFYAVYQWRGPRMDEKSRKTRVAEPVFRCWERLSIFFC